MRSLARRIPQVVIFGLLALALTIFTGAVWSGLLIANLATSASLPWAVVVMAGLLWLMSQSLGGRWASPERRRRLRARPVSGARLAWALAAGGLAIAALAGLWPVLSQLAKVRGSPLPDFSRYPLITVLLVVAMASLATAAAEEAGFRGYFQGLLEEKAGGPLAILIAAVVIAPAHGLTQGFGWPSVLFYLLVDMTFGALAYLTQSILPGLLVHALGLVIFFTLVWPKDTALRLVANGGADAMFWLHLAQAVICASLALLAFGRLAQASRRAA
jgi:membrane protease YdiL (CAAX protease family)